MNHRPLPESLLTREQAAEFLGLKAATLATWASTQRYDLPYIKVGRAVRYRMSDLETFLDANTFCCEEDDED